MQQLAFRWLHHRAGQLQKCCLRSKRKGLLSCGASDRLVHKSQLWTAAIHGQSAAAQQQVLL